MAAINLSSCLHRIMLEMVTGITFHLNQANVAKHVFDHTSNMPNSVHISWHLSFVLELPLFFKGLTMCNFNCEPCFCRTFWQFGSEFLFLANLSIRSRLFKHWHSKRKMFLSICSLDKHCIKFGCPKPKSSSCPKSLVRNSKTIRHLMFLITLFPL